jgi:hypothetical protein
LLPSQVSKSSLAQSAEVGLQRFFRSVNFPQAIGKYALEAETKFPKLRVSP